VHGAGIPMRFDARAPLVLISIAACGNGGSGGPGGPTADGSPPRLDAIPLHIAAGGQHTCAVTPDGAVRCWGAGNASQLGQGRAGDSSVGLLVPGVSDVDQVALGYEFSCARAKSGATQCWGANPRGALGDGTTAIQVSPRPVTLSIDHLPDQAQGHWSSCALHDGGQVSCWGDDSSGQLGTGGVDSDDHAAPARVEVPAAARLALGYFHACAALVDGRVTCWGSNGWGELGDGDISSTPVATPVMVDGLTDAVRLAAGQQWTCALRTGGTLACWGDNRNGQLGDGTTMFRPRPVEVPGLSGVVHVAAGRKHACAVTSEGALWCWGRNDVGQLGDGSTMDRHAPTRVDGLSGVVAVALGDLHTCALLEDGGVRCFGSNARGQLGDGSTTDRDRPVTVMWP